MEVRGLKSIVEKMELKTNPVKHDKKLLERIHNSKFIPIPEQCTEGVYIYPEKVDKTMDEIMKDYKVLGKK